MNISYAAVAHNQNIALLRYSIHSLQFVNEIADPRLHPSKSTNLMQNKNA